jgi:catechol 2,3-dioxygenase-like lactoylglutathione lyase family enzyme
MADGPIKVSRIIHTIHAVEDIRASREKYLDIMGGLIFAENYFEAEDRDAALLYVTDHMVEPMAPRTLGRLEKPFARFVNTHGQCFHSFELGIEDGPAASKLFRDNGCTVAADYGFFFFVKPESTGGVMLEVCAVPMPNDPYDRGHWDPRVGQGHASTILCLDHIACVTADMDAALNFFTRLVDGAVLTDERVSTPQPGRRVLIRLGDTNIAFIQPDDTSAGPLGEFLNKPQSGIYALVWCVADESKALAHFDKKGLSITRESCVSEGFAIDPADFLDGRHEFVTSCVRL